MSDTPRNPRSGPVYEVEFSLHDSAYPFVGASEAEGCTFELAEMVPRSDGQYAEFFDVTNADSDRVEALAAAHDAVDVTRLREYDDGALFEFRVSGDCPAFTLAELGALPREVRSVDGEGHIAAEIPPQYDPSAVVEAFLETYPDAELAAKQKRDSFGSMFTRSALEQAMDSTLTDRQYEVLEAAFEAGYYEWPRDSTGEEVAADLGISSATFAEHVRTAERKLLAELFCEPSGDRP